MTPLYGRRGETVSSRAPAGRPSLPDAGVAVRFEDYSDFGSAVNGKLSGRLDLSDKFSVRSTVSHRLPRAQRLAGVLQPALWDPNRAFPFPQLGFTYGWETLPFGINGGSYFTRLGYRF